MNLIEKTESWFSTIKKEHKEIFFELDILLKALDRFFSVEFVAFFNHIFTIEGSGPHKILEKIHNFKIFLETALRQISVRAELKEMPLDI